MHPPSKNAPASPPKHGPIDRIARWAVFGATAIAIWLASLFFPIVADTSLDSSWQFALNYGRIHRLIFGRDLVFTYGPWGWLTLTYFNPATFTGRVGWELGWKAFAAILTVSLAGSLHWPRRLALIAAALLLMPVFGDTLPFLVIAGLVLSIARTAQPRPAVVAAISTVLGLLALQKFTYFVLVGSGVAGVGLFFAARREWRTFAWLTGSCAASLVIWWLAAGQPLAALPLFVQHSAWISSGYSEAMFVTETAPVFYLGFGSALLYLFLVWDAPRWRTLPIGLTLTAFGFLSWKQGFVRADGHTLGFFSTMVFAGIVAPFINPTPSLRRTVASWTLGVVALFGSVAAVPGLMSVLHYLLRNHLVENTSTLFSLGKYRDDLAHRTAAAAAANDLPAVRAAVGRATIDQFGYEQAMLLFNRLNYDPRPVPQGYQCYSGPLAALNENFYLSPKAPAFTLARLQTIDGRLPAFDDAALLPHLETDHDLVLSEKDFLLLRRHPVAAPLVRRALTSGKLRYRIETCALPATRDAVWVRIDTPYSWLGWLRTVFYKPPQVTLVVTETSSNEQSFRLVAPATRGGFLLSPLLLGTSDLQRLLADRIGRPVRSFRLEIAPGDAIYFLKRARYELFALPDLTFKTAASTATGPTS